MHKDKFRNAELTVLYFHSVLQTTNLPFANALAGLPDINDAGTAMAVVEVLRAMALPKTLSDLRNVAIQQLKYAMEPETVAAVA